MLVDGRIKFGFDYWDFSFYYFFKINDIWMDINIKIVIFFNLKELIVKCRISFYILCMLCFLVFRLVFSGYRLRFIFSV